MGVAGSDAEGVGQRVLAERQLCLGVDVGPGGGRGGHGGREIRLGRVERHGDGLFPVALLTREVGEEVAAHRHRGVDSAEVAVAEVPRLVAQALRGVDGAADGQRLKLAGLGLTQVLREEDPGAAVRSAHDSLAACASAVGVTVGEAGHRGVAGRGVRGAGDDRVGQGGGAKADVVVVERDADIVVGDKDVVESDVGVLVDSENACVRALPGLEGNQLCAPPASRQDVHALTHAERLVVDEVGTALAALGGAVSEARVP
mmetsp:Transcript_4007/g.9511  ORF Transcript_4007/g.9511 Transcript_4007/m.9511 type:complete len:259 (-) Transcript_4007:8894-9670(-)